MRSTKRAHLQVQSSTMWQATHRPSPSLPRMSTQARPGSATWQRPTSLRTSSKPFPGCRPKTMPTRASAPCGRASAWTRPPTSLGVGTRRAGAFLRGGCTLPFVPWPSLASSTCRRGRSRQAASSSSPNHGSWSPPNRTPWCEPATQTWPHACPMHRSMASAGFAVELSVVGGPFARWLWVPVVCGQPHTQ